MFGGDHNHLSPTAAKSYNERTPKGSGGGGGYNQRSQGKSGDEGGRGAAKDQDKYKDEESGAGRGKDPFKGEKAPREGRIRISPRASKDNLSSNSRVDFG